MVVAENFSGSRTYISPSGPNARRGYSVEASREDVPISDGLSKPTRAHCRESAEGRHPGCAYSAVV